MEPMASRVPDADYQAMQQFITDSPWDPEELMNSAIKMMNKEVSSPDGIISLDDTSFPKQGNHSVGVGRQYCGALGKIANCQAATSALYTIPSTVRNRDSITWPLGMKLYLPKKWIADKERRDKAGIPKDVIFEEKWSLGLELIDNARKLGVRHSAITSDSGYGNVSDFRSELRKRTEPYIVGVTPTAIGVIPAETKLIGPEDFPPVKSGRPRTRSYLPPNVKSKNAIEIANEIPKEDWRDIRWTEKDKKLHGLYVMRHVRVIKNSHICTDEICWLLLEKREDDELRVYLCWGFTEPSLELFAKSSRNRFHIEKGYREMKDELGIDHFEGRSRTGWYHHTVLTQIAYGYLAYTRFESQDDDDEEPLPTIPEVRRDIVKEIALKVYEDLFGINITKEYDKGHKRFSDFLARMT